MVSLKWWRACPWRPEGIYASAMRTEQILASVCFRLSIYRWTVLYSGKWPPNSSGCEAMHTQLDLSFICLNVNCFHRSECCCCTTVGVNNKLSTWSINVFRILIGICWFNTPLLRPAIDITDQVDVPSYSVCLLTPNRLGDRAAVSQHIVVRNQHAHQRGLQAVGLGPR